MNWIKVISSDIPIDTTKDYLIYINIQDSTKEPQYKKLLVNIKQNPITKMYYFFYNGKYISHKKVLAYVAIDNFN